MMLNHSSLHYFVMQHMVDKGFAPKIAALCDHFAVARSDMVTALKSLQEYHGVVLHPQSSEVWVMHPFANAPTSFYIESGSQSWWGNCAWCSLGAAAILDRDLTITTTLGSESQQAVIEINNGQLNREDLYIHFPIPMQSAWDNVIYTCSTMLMFRSEADIDDWCTRHDMNKGDVQPIANIWEFAKVWYGQHLDPNWQKWSVSEAQEIFTRFQLINPIWELPSVDDRF